MLHLLPKKFFSFLLTVGVFVVVVVVVVVLSVFCLLLFVFCMGGLVYCCCCCCCCCCLVNVLFKVCSQQGGICFMCVPLFFHDYFKKLKNKNKIFLAFSSNLRLG